MNRISEIFHLWKQCYKDLNNKKSGISKTFNPYKNDRNFVNCVPLFVFLSQAILTITTKR